MKQQLVIAVVFFSLGIAASKWIDTKKRDQNRNNERRNSTETPANKGKNKNKNEDTGRKQQRDLVVKPIAFVKSVFKARNFTPNQPSRVVSSRARIDMVERNSGCLDNLAEFSHIWIIFHFHDNNQPSKKSKILPPRKPDNIKVGVFSCRSPNRPNPIGLSLVKLERVDKANFQLFVSCVDLLDKTPILDIKPFIPSHDSPLGDTSVSSWVKESSMLSPDFHTVEILPAVSEKLSKLDLRRSLYNSPEEIITVLKEILCWDGRKRHQREEHNRAGHGEWLFEMNPGLEFVLHFPSDDGVVQCVDVVTRGKAKMENGRVVFSEK